MAGRQETRVTINKEFDSFDQFIQDHGMAGALKKLVIPNDCVQNVRDQLDLAGVFARLRSRPGPPVVGHLAGTLLWVGHCSSSYGVGTTSGGLLRGLVLLPYARPGV